MALDLPIYCITGSFDVQKNKVPFAKAIRGISNLGKRIKIDINCYICDADDPGPNSGGYFPHCDTIEFVQCGFHNGFYEVLCAPGTVWNQYYKTC